MCSDVFVTGVGIVSPAGNTAESTWESLLAGRRFIQPLQNAELTGCCTQFGGEITPFVPVTGPEQFSRTVQLALKASEECLSSNTFLSLQYNSYTNYYLHISFGISKSLISGFGSTSVSDVKHSAPDAPALSIAKRFPHFNAVHATVGACATGMLAAIRGIQMIQDGEADGVLCGGADASLHPLWAGSFEQMGLLAEPHPELGPGWACRPFDRTRAGFALGEGAGVLMLESEAAMAKSGSKPLVRIAGYAIGTDPAGLTQLTPSGEILARVIEIACHRAGHRPDQIVCIHAHGTGTIMNDMVEARAIRKVFDQAAERIPVISLKGAIGHLLGGAGAVELAVAALTCRNQRSPGNATLIDPDPELGVLNLPKEPFEIPHGPVLKISMGFGGHIAAVVLAPV